MWLRYGPKYENVEWKSRTNWEIEEMSKGENTVKWIKEQRISWLGHLERMEEDRMPKKIFTQELEGTRWRGRPRKGRKEEAETDLQVLEVKRWRELVLGENRRILFDRPKPTVGCSANGRRRRWSLVWCDDMLSARMYWVSSTVYCLSLQSLQVKTQKVMQDDHWKHHSFSTWLHGDLTQETVHSKPLFVP